MSKIHNARELEKAAKKAGCTVQTGGNHPHIITPSGCVVPYPNHSGRDICIGMLHSILKMLKAAGVILGLVIAWAIVNPAFGYNLWCLIFGAA